MLVMAGPGQRFYEDDEAEEILSLAATMSSTTGSVTRERLLETAAELGISPEAVEAAEKQVAARRLDAKLQAEFHALQRKEFGSHLVPYLFCNALFVFFSLRSDRFWAIWPIMGWGIGLAAHAWASFNPKSTAYQDRYRTWKAQQLGEPQTAELSALAEPSRPSITVGVHIPAGRYGKHHRYRGDRHVQ
jgi:hypothetical protein